MSDSDSAFRGVTRDEDKKFKKYWAIIMQY
jgi:hypothetical protein